MTYQIAPFGALWQEGMFSVPFALVDKYIKIASEYQLKALLCVLRNGGSAETQDIAKALGLTSNDVDELMEFWSEEGIFPSASPEPQKPAEPEKTEVKTVRRIMSAPTLTPADVVRILRESSELNLLLNEAQTVLGRTISHAEQELLINMVNYYGLPAEVVLMILEFYRGEKAKGRSVGIAYINAMAKNWAEEGIDTVTLAEEKLKDIEKSDRLWNEVVAITGLRHRRPTQKQRETVKGWFEDFDITMITLASDIMKENTSEPKLAYMDGIIKQWRKRGITSPAQLQAEQEAFEKSRADKKGAKGKLKSEPTYDLDKIKQDAINNTEI